MPYLFVSLLFSLCLSIYNALLQKYMRIGVDVTIETGGGGTLEKTMEATRIGGTISLIGVLTGGTINPTTVMRKSIRLQGVYVGMQGSQWYATRANGGCRSDVGYPD